MIPQVLKTMKHIETCLQWSSAELQHLVFPGWLQIYECLIGLLVTGRLWGMTFANLVIFWTHLRGGALTCPCAFQVWRTGRTTRSWRRCWPSPSRSIWTAWNTRVLPPCTERGRRRRTAADTHIHTQTRPYKPIAPRPPISEGTQTNKAASFSLNISFFLFQTHSWS